MTKEGWPETPEELLAMLHRESKSDGELNIHVPYLVKMFGSEEALTAWCEANGVRKYPMYSLRMPPDFDAMEQKAIEEIAQLDRKAAMIARERESEEKYLAEIRSRRAKTKKRPASSNG